MAQYAREQLAVLKDTLTVGRLLPNGMTDEKSITSLVSVCPVRRVPVSEDVLGPEFSTLIARDHRRLLLVEIKSKLAGLPTEQLASLFAKLQEMENRKSI